MEKFFTQDDAWDGGFYELSFKLSQVSQASINEFLEKMWSTPYLEGCFQKNDVEPRDQTRMSILCAENQGHWYGIAHLPNGKKSCCGSHWGDYGGGGNWVTLYLPMGSLSRVYETNAYPFKTAKQDSNSWMSEVNNWFREIAEQVYPLFQYELAAIGFELNLHNILSSLKHGIPSERWDGIIIAKETELFWFPPTIYDPPFEL